MKETNVKNLAFCIVGCILSAILAISFLNMTAVSVGAQPGSTDDPLVTRSYVDNLFAQLTGGGANNQAVVSDVMAQIEQLYGDALRGGAAVFRPVEALAGQRIIGHEGTELILRSGTATAHAPGENGLSNLTQGADLMHGANITANHLLLIPRRDGRGVYVTQDAWFLIKGGYDIT